MIIRSGLIRNRDGVDFDRFTNHWLNVHGPLALQVAGMRAYTQNHIVKRVAAVPESTLHRIDGISQLYFDDIESMRIAMDSDEQRACIEDIQDFLSDVTILIQQQGERRRFGSRDNSSSKLLFLIGGETDTMARIADCLLHDFEASGWNGCVRLNLVVDRSFAVDPTVPAGGQMVDGVLEIWASDVRLTEAAEMLQFAATESAVFAGFELQEHVLLPLPSATG